MTGRTGASAGGRPFAFLAVLAAFAVLASLAAGAVPCRAETELTIAPNSQLDFANRLMEEGEYYRAVTEYKRFLHFFPDHPRAAEARLAIGEAYMRGGKYAEAVAALDQVANEPVTRQIETKARYLICETYERQEEFGLAEQCLDYMLATAGDGPAADEALYRKGWLFVERGSYDLARDSFSRLTESGREAYRIPQLLAALEVGEQSLDPKNPAVAGALAVIPGVGHLYTGRYRDALIAFAVNAALGFAAYEAFDEDMQVLGGIITTVGLGFYAGSIYGAVGSAHKANKRQREGLTNHLRRSAGVRMGAGYWPNNQGLALCFEFRF